MFVPQDVTTLLSTNGFHIISERHMYVRNKIEEAGQHYAMLI